MSTNLLRSDVQRGCRSADLELKIISIWQLAIVGLVEIVTLICLGGRRVSMSHAGTMEHKLCCTESACTQC